MLTAGVVGCGKASKSHHLPVIEALDGLDLQWVCDLDESRARAASNEYGAPWYADVEEALGDPPDVVHVNTPPFTHEDVATSALEAGAHVLVEKPMAMTEDECRSIVRTAGAQGRKLCVVHNNLYFDPMQRVLRGVERGEYGDLVSVRSYLGRLPEESDDREWTDHGHGGPIVGDRLPHPIYLVTHFLDDVGDATVRLTRTDDGVVDGVAVQVTDGETFGDVQVSERAIPSKAVRVVGSRKMALVDLFNYSAVEYDTVDRSPVSIVTDNVGAAGQLVRDTTGNVLDYARDVVSSGSKYAGPGHYNLVEAFRESIENDTPPPVSGEEGVKVVALLNEVDRVAESE